METKWCNGCRKDVDTKEFEKFLDTGKTRLRGRCRPCRKEQLKERWPQEYIKRKAARSDPKQRARFLVRDSRDDDRWRGHANDLDVEWVNKVIADDCSYCGETRLMMSLDRQNNELGHLKSNVVAACVRCNAIRRNMPLAAWRTLVPSIRAAREAGLFADWKGW